MIFANDVLVLQGDARAVHQLTQEARLQVVGTAKTPDQTLAPAQIGAVEAVVMGGSQLVGRTPSDLRLRDRFGVNLVGISRPGQASNARLGRTRFKVGDVVILQGSTVGTPGRSRRPFSARRF